MEGPRLSIGRHTLGLTLPGKAGLRSPYPILGQDFQLGPLRSNAADCTTPASSPKPGSLWILDQVTLYLLHRSLEASSGLVRHTDKYTA